MRHVAAFVLWFALLATPAFSRELRVIGGSAAAEETKEQQDVFSSFVLITKENDLCGGTLIASNLVLTAAHCVYSSTAANKTLIDASTITVGKGPNLGLNDEGSLFPVNADGVASVRKMIPHPKYATRGPDDLLDDIAILVLNGTLPGPIAKLAKPKASQKLPTGSEMTVVGFGYNNGFPLKPNGKKDYQPYFSPTLYQLTLALGQISEQPCDYPDLDNKKQLCMIGKKISFPFPNSEDQVVREEGYQSSCKGDSGGPLYYKGTQYGLVSYGKGFCTEFQAKETVFTKISAYRKSFIDPIVKKYGR